MAVTFLNRSALLLCRLAGCILQVAAKRRNYLKQLAYSVAEAESSSSGSDGEGSNSGSDADTEAGRGTKQRRLPEPVPIRGAVSQPGTRSRRAHSRKRPRPPDPDEQVNTAPSVELPPSCRGSCSAAEHQLTRVRVWCSILQVLNLVVHSGRLVIASSAPITRRQIRARQPL